MAHGLGNAGNDTFGLLLPFRVCVRAELQVNTVNVVGLLVKQCRLAGMECRFKPEPTLRGMLDFHFHIGNEEAFFKVSAFKTELIMARVGERAPSQATA